MTNSDPFSDPYKIESDRFHKALGYCIAKWADIEDQLFRLCWTALRAPPEQSSIVYYRTPSVDARLTLITELIGTVFPKDEEHADLKHEAINSWGELAKDIRSLLKTRNRLAHHPVNGRPFHYAIDDGDEISTPEMATIFHSYVGQYERWRGKKADAGISYADLDRYYPKLCDIQRRLDRYFHLFLKRRVGEPVMRSTNEDVESEAGVK